MQDSSSLDQSSIAIIGMAGRFPGAGDIAEFWRNLAGGVESIVRLTDAQLLAAGVESAELRDPAYVKAAAVLDDIDLFDASFFGFSAKDAAIMDPQHRLFLECAWHAFEHAGWAIEQFDGKVGVYAGSGLNTYLIHNLLANRKLVSEAGLFVLKQTGNDKDVLATRVSYQLDLTGPSLAVQTACSTSLVAVHLACQALLNGECDMALAGGVTIEIPHGRGYHYREGEILARDGHCRPFDADSSGTIFGSGVGTVVLRRLEDALRDGDTVHAIIRGTAINNDGSRKVGFLAPSVAGQAEVIAEAMAAAGVDADSISYVEAHGTGTKVGDPIELEALTRSFRESTDRRGFCAVGSVKANVGHLDAAAGVAGLIKTTLALQHRQLPPTINFNRPNPLIDFASSPFFVTSAVREWRAETAVRRAGVTSLGIGGTNAHVILEEAPAREASSPLRNHELLTLSAKTPAALDAMARNLADYLEGDTQLDDVAFTCHLGRAALPYRRAIVCGDSREAVSLLRHASASKVISRTAAEGESTIVFLFSGQGAQYPEMAHALYETDPGFKSVVDYCCEFLKPLLGMDLRSVIFPAPNATADTASLLAQTRITQPALFVIEYALAQLWIRIGIKPAAMLGHSIGEFTAACVAGVFSLDDTLQIVAERGRLMQSLPAGLMIAVAETEADVRKILDSRCTIASVNAQDQCVVAGAADAIAEVEAELGRRKLSFQRLQVSHAFHSPMMDPIVEPFAAFVGHFQAKQPAVRWVSSATGTWIGAEEATQPAYWARQLRGTVRFHDGVTTLLKAGSRIFVEAGPGHTLASLVVRHPERPAALETISTLSGARENVPADVSFLRALGVLWASGAKIDWRRYHRGERRYRVALPGYPFERRRYWVDPDPPAVIAIAAPDSAKAEAANANFGGLFQPVWKAAELSAAPGSANSITGPWLIFADTGGLGDRAAAMLRDRGEKVTIVRAGEAFARRDGDEIRINPANRSDYDELVAAMRAGEIIPRRVLHLWSVLRSIPPHDELDELDDTIAASFWSILFFAQAFAGEIDGAAGCRLVIGSNQLVTPEGEQSERPERALLAGPCGVIPSELPDVQCVHVDFVMPSDVAASNGNRDHALGDIALQIITELDGNAGDSPVAYRRGRRFVRTHKPLARRRQPITLRDGAVHLITGGLGGMGLVLAEAIAQASKARLVLLGRRALPPRDEWPRITERGGELAATVRKIEAIERCGAEVMTIAADVTDESSMRAALAAIHQRFGAVTSVIHAAGTIADEPLLTKSQSSAAAVLAPKVRGTLVLEHVFGNEPLDYMILCSSVSSIIVPAGQVDYAAANAFLDAFAQARSSNTPYPIIALQFPRWRDVGMAADRDASKGLVAGTSNHADSGAKPAEFTAQITLNLASNWIVGEHRMLDGTGLFPGTGYVEMILAAAQELLPGERITIRDLQFKLPLEVAPDVTRHVRRTLRRDGEDYHFTASAQTEAGWPECATARITRERDHEVASYDLPALRRRCADHELIFTHRQNRVQEGFFNFGPRWNALERIGFGQGEALVSVELAGAFLGDLDSYKVHPALLDMATGAGLFLIPNYESLHRAYVPMNYGRITVLRRLPRRFYSYIRIRAESSADEPVVTFDADILDEKGNGLIEIREFMMRRVDDGLRLAAQMKPAPIAPGPSVTLNRAERPRDSFMADDGAAAFRSVLNGAWAANVVAFPSDFVAFAQAAQPRRALQRIAGSSNGAQMRDEIERNLAQWWRELLGADSLTPQSDFFEMGGQSLTAVRLFAKIKNGYGLQLSPATIFEAPTIRKLAQLIREGMGQAVTVESSLSPVKTTGPAPAIDPANSRMKSGSLIELKRGGPRCLFIVHDGEGGTLLYLNLATRMHEDVAVFAIEPRRLARVPLPHSTMEEMAAFYLEEIRAKQPNGPYRLAGLCAGGVIAYEMASQLIRAGERVQLLALLEAAAPNAVERHGLREQRVGRMKEAIARARKSEPSRMKRALAIGEAISQKLTSALLWEASQRTSRWWVRVRFRLLREVLRRGLAWPRFVPELSVREIYDCLQASYTPKPLTNSSVVLVRAKAGEGDETPYREIYADETFGWNAFTPGIRCIDVEGGHSTMLQEHFVDSLADALLPYLRQSDDESEVAAKSRPVARLETAAP
jgi:acyl transferase domain-containing protein/thioesterase domain-containing protein/acyl carrier protein